MKALSVRQPWSWLIVNGHKDVENRTWPPTKYISVPQRIYIHTGKKPDNLDRDRVIRIENLIDDVLPFYRFMQYGAIVGEVDIVGFERYSKSPWAESGMCHWQLENPVAYPEPLPYKGNLGLFEVTL